MSHRLQYLGAEFWQVKKPLDAKEKGMKPMMGSVERKERH